MMPWGTDQAWRNRLKFDGDGGQLFDSCLGDASCAAMYRQAVVEVRDKVTALDLGSEGQSLASMLAPWQAIDPRRESSPEGSAAAVTGAQLSSSFGQATRRPGSMSRRRPRIRLRRTNRSCRGSGRFRQRAPRRPS